MTVRPRTIAGAIEGQAVKAGGLVTVVLVATLFIAVLALVAAGCGSPPATPGATAPPPIPDGRELYQRHGCGLCHGPEGRGDGPKANLLSPPPPDLTDPRSYVFGTTPEEIALTIERGLLELGGGMPSYRHLSQEERLAIARYLVSIRRPGPDNPAGDPE